MFNEKQNLPLQYSPNIYTRLLRKHFTNDSLFQLNCWRISFIAEIIIDKLIMKSNLSGFTWLDRNMTWPCIDLVIWFRFIEHCAFSCFNITCPKLIKSCEHMNIDQSHNAEYLWTSTIETARFVLMLIANRSFFIEIPVSQSPIIIIIDVNEW